MEVAVLQDTPDEELVSLFVQGDVRAFEMLVSRYRVRLYNFIFYRISDREKANDLLQEVFLRVVRGASSFSGQSLFKTWLYTIARNQCTDHLRRARHRRIEILDPAMDGEEDRVQSHVLQSADQGPGPDRLAESMRIQERLQTALESLPEEQREVFVLKEREGLTFAEIAEIQGINANSAKSRMRYALNGLRQALKDYESQ